LFLPGASFDVCNRRSLSPGMRLPFPPSRSSATTAQGSAVVVIHAPRKLTYKVIIPHKINKRLRSVPMHRTETPKMGNQP